MGQLTIITLFIMLSLFVGAIIFSYLNNKINNHMAKTKEDFDNLKQDMDAQVGNVRGDVSGLKTKIGALETRINELLGEAGLTAAEEQEVFNMFAGVKDDISSLAGDTPEEPETPAE